MAQRLHLEVRDRLAGHVRHGHAEQDRVDVVAHHHVALEVRGRLGVVRVEVQRVVVHGQQAEQVVVVLRDGLARPVPVNRADLELLEVPSKLHAYEDAVGGDAMSGGALPGARRPRSVGRIVPAPTTLRIETGVTVIKL